MAAWGRKLRCPRARAAYQLHAHTPRTQHPPAACPPARPPAQSPHTASLHPTPYAPNPAPPTHAVGCIFAEMLGRKPLLPGKDFIHQLNLVCRAVGSPGPDDVTAVQSERARHYLASMPHFPTPGARAEGGMRGVGEGGGGAALPRIHAPLPHPGCARAWGQRVGGGWTGSGGGEGGQYEAVHPQSTPRSHNSRPFHTPPPTAPPPPPPPPPPPRARADMQQWFPQASPAAIDLLRRLMVFNPAHRLTAEQALAHPYLASLRDPDDEPSCPQVLARAWVGGGCGGWEGRCGRLGCLHGCEPASESLAGPPSHLPTPTLNPPPPPMQRFHTPEEDAGRMDPQQIREALYREMLAFNPDMAQFR